MPEITLPDSSKRKFDSPVSLIDIAKDIGPGLAKATIAGVVNGKEVDSNFVISDDSDVSILTDRSDQGLFIIRHSTAHLMAMAIKQLHPSAQVTIGPVIEDGFYYDIAFERTFTPDDLEAIEVKMSSLAREDHGIFREEWDRDEAAIFFKSIGENYKAEIIDSIPAKETISLYRQGEFVDLCRGPHVPSTGKLGVFKLTKVAGAYWRGDQNNAMLQRIYGTAWASKKELKAYINRLAEAEKRDHRKLGRKFDLFHFSDDAPGSVFWHPKGWALFLQLLDYMRKRQEDNGYVEVNTPDVMDRSLWETSGHWFNYRENMFLTQTEDERVFALKPMNCPGSVSMFAQGLKSYRDLPLRMAEFGKVHRYEPSGALHGLMRVRHFTQDDAHIYCTEEQFKKEFMNVCNMYLEYFELFDIKKYMMRLSLHDKKDLGDKYVDEPELWLETEQWVREALDEGGFNYVEVPGEAAFYGPKIDVQVWSAIGKEFTLATNQVDFVVPKRFDLTYKDEKGHLQTPICIHRAPLSTHERFIGFLIEHFGGNFPLWLAPTQVAVLPVSDKVNGYASSITKKLIDSDIRAVLDDRSDKIGAKIRNAEISRTNVMLIVGPKEQENNTVSVRRKFSGDLGTVDQDMLISALIKEIKDRSLTHS